VGTWSSIIVLTSFLFGIIIFEEKVKDFYHTCYAFLVLVIGLIGMAKYSASSEVTEPGKITPAMTKRSSKRRSKQTQDSFNNGHPTSPSPKKQFFHPNGPANLQPLEIEPLLEDEITEHHNGGSQSMMDVDLGDDNDYDSKLSGNKDRMIFCGGRMALTRRQTGIIGAVINGAWGGLNLIPLHYARRDDGLTGAAFLVSFATGSLIVNTILWLLLIAYRMHEKKGNWDDVKDSLPKFHVAHLWKAGLGAGLLYSLGNFSALLAVTYLGQGVGFSFCQLQLLVSGLWGVFFFKEIRGRRRIFKWFLSAAIAVVGIIWLSYQHEGGSAGHRRHLSYSLEEPFEQPQLFGSILLQLPLGDTAATI
jgi:hypothetical protein